MVAVKGHFDGRVFVPDEPINLPQNQRIIMHIEPLPEQTFPAGPRPGSAAGKVRMSDDFDAPLDDFADHME
jgi:hypothetical protein